MTAWKAVRFERVEVRLLRAPLKEGELAKCQAPLETDANPQGFGDRDLRLPLFHFDSDLELNLASGLTHSGK
jgi:hypothetical protein